MNNERCSSMNDSTSYPGPVDLTTPDARLRRDALAARVDVLDKVGALRALPDDMHVTTDMVAAFYGVPVKTIQTVVLRNQEEIAGDGYRVSTRSAFEATFNMKAPSSASRIALFPRRAVLRIGMLLRDSAVARRVRDYLLNAESVSVMSAPMPTAAELPDRKALARMVIEAEEARELAEARLAELAPKAAMADDFLVASGGARLVREVAKLLGMRERDLRQFLLDEELIFAKHSQCGAVQYDYYAQFAHHFKATEHIVNHTWGSCTHYTLMILPRGVELIQKRRARAAKPQLSLHPGGAR